MNAANPISGVAWENRLLNLLRHELAPSPARWRASIRLCALCVLGTAFISAFHIPGGQFIVLILFLVGMNDAATSRATLASNLAGSLVGGSLGVLSMAAFMDQPWILFPVQAVVITAAMYVMRRCSRPLSMLFFMVSFVVIAPEMQTAPLESFYAGIRAVAFQTLGIALGTLGQMLWWPEDPAKLLLDDLAESLRSIEQVFARRPGGELEAAASDSPARSLRDSAARLTRQLDYLRQAEAKDQWLRQRHTEQIKLITDIQLLVFAALEWEERVTASDTPTALAGGIAERLAAIREECGRLRRAIAQELFPSPKLAVAAGSIHSVDAAKLAEADLASSNRLESAAQCQPEPTTFPELDELERLLSTLPGSLNFLSIPKAPDQSHPIREPVGRQSFLTPVSPVANLEAIHFGLKVALAASICGLLYQALDWPQIGTCVLTTILVAQATVGSGLHKSALRFGGALLAGLAVLLVIGGIMPNLQSLGSLVILSGVLAFIASWIVSGSSRIAYLGAQMGITLYLVLLPGLGPIVELVPARDRLIGILLGIVVMTVVDAVLWPVFTHSALRRMIAGLLRESAEVLRLITAGDASNVRAKALGIHRGIAAALTLQEELIFEKALRDPRAETERRVVLRSINRLQEVFLGILALSREREALAKSGPAETSPLHFQGGILAEKLTGLAGLLEGSTPVGPGFRKFAPPETNSKIAPDQRSELANSPPESSDGRLTELMQRLSDSVGSLERDIHPLLPPAGATPTSPGIARTRPVPTG